ncbi:Procollagen galactosyltransferase 1 [Neolecta irregularis DAH-3]|uniref:Procollagen galactosyltransferase 1 n=1 Tax=Neolecta irregularis (strain DAH-3) TaxID=1198029 RepID=A0A1U7LMC5_NEOID|nr:Procollagen galactosyltransferase 1 [Neolecta irregularis DAH-3]|eukprot:OLL23797.1 Procollagen galactosyltransferase 1 [Neolecta irregularis DAH-3]
MQRVPLAAILIRFLVCLRHQGASVVVSTYDTEPSLQVSSVYNETLGFGRIYCTNLPHRTDRRDAMQLNSIMSGISVEFIDGVYGDKIDNRALVGHPDRNMPEGEKDGVWGCWRGHLNALNAFLDSGLEAILPLRALLKR